MRFRLAICWSVPWLFTPAYSQIKTDYSQTAEYYIKNVLMGEGVTVGKVKHYGMIGGLGQFDADAKILGVKSGMVLSTGHIDSLRGPNNQSGCTSQGKLPDNRKIVREILKGDADLNKLCRGKTRDITMIEFEFVPIRNVIEFNYVFASEEYPEYVNSRFNDVFGFFLTGPGIKKKVNLAVLADGKTPVSINSINSKRNAPYYRSNKRRVGLFKRMFGSKQKLLPIQELKKYLQMDGITVVMKVHYDVIPFKKYRIKIAIGDAGDTILDSVVFIEAGSFKSVEDTSGKYFAKVVESKNKHINVDSILAYKPITDTASEEEEHEESFNIADVFFDTNSDELSDTAQTMLIELSAYLKKHPNLNCSMVGYTDNRGSKKLNKELSDKRALRVMAFLQSQGIEMRRMRYAGMGFNNPRATNQTEVGRARNRRVEIVMEAN